MLKLPLTVMLSISLLPVATAGRVAASIGIETNSQASKVTAVPAVVTANWERLIGTWVADNSGYKTDANPIDAYGLEWTWGLGQKSLIGRLYGIVDGKDIGTFWQFREFWHPGDGTVVATQFGGDGTYGVGPHDIRSDGTSEMVQTFFDPTAHTTTKVGHRSTLEGDVHTTASFDVAENGQWTARRTYTWHRR